MMNGDDVRSCSSGDAVTSAAATIVGGADDNLAILTCADDDGRVHWRPWERFHHLFENRLDEMGSEAARIATAVEYAGESFSFADIEALANGIARYVKKLGARDGDRIGLLFDRSIYSYAAVLAVSKIGAVFVPLDASLPSDRLNYILEDSTVDIVLTMSAFASLFAASDLTVVSLDAARGEFQTSTARLPGVGHSRLPEDALCYIIYTSGSTGRPKGVQIRHSSICNFLRVACRSYGYEESDRVYQALTIAFDYSFEEIWVPLLSGARLVPAPSGPALVGADLAEFLRENEISAFCCVPTLLATIEEELPDLRLLIVSGEACPQDLMTRWWKQDRRILNLYGPTEATVSATWNELHSDRTVTIGRPLPTYAAMILSLDEPALLTRGAIGEIGLAGIGLAAGYVNRPEDTEKAFIRDFVGIANNPPGRIYRTGDLGRINESNEIEYLGRIDTQIKIRGYRIELDEIETVAREIPGIQSFVCNPVEAEPGNFELAAYFTPGAGNVPLDPAAIHAALRERLPSYMVPVFYEELEAIPRLPSNKVDRKNLPAPTHARLSPGASFVAPRTEREIALARLLANLLRIERVSMDADFFADLGANSLLMARYIAKIRDDLGSNCVSIRQVYQNPSVEKLALAIGPPIERAGPETPPRQDVAFERHVASNAEYILCGALQMAWYAVVAFVGCVALLAAFAWIEAAATATGIYARAAASAAMLLTGSSALLIAVKWIAIGRFDTEKIPIWSVRYVCFWIAQSAIRANPLNLFAGTPLYNWYLRMLGAEIGDRAVIFAHTPVCTDLISVGHDAVVRQDCLFPGYTAHAGYLQPGPVTIGDRAFVGEATVLGINTRIGCDAQLGTTSALLQGQSVPDGKIYQGSPAHETATDFVRVPPVEMSVPRPLLYAVGQILAMVFVAFPVPIIGSYLLIDLGFFGFGEDAATPAASVGMLDLLWYSATAYLGIVALGLVVVMTVPRLFNMFFVPDRPHPLFGLQYFLARAITRFSNSTMLHEMFGDSSMIVHYFRALGYDLSESTQTGSNFGVEQRHHSPFLCKFSRNTLVSDGLTLLNMDVSSTSFRMSMIAVPEETYIGNDVHYPTGARLGKNCLVATKAMIPLDGPVRENVGILGSPPFEIPRSVERDRQFDHYKQPGVLESRLRMKLRSNLVTLTLVMVRNWSALFLAMTMWSGAHTAFTGLVSGSIPATAALLAALALTSTLVVATYFILFERGALLMRPMRPLYCSLYERDFWDHERFWKLNINPLIMLFDGTPIKNLMIRCQGARLGKKIFDNGASISEPLMVEIGDHACLNHRCTIQGHSLEDGTFKSDFIRIGDRCTIGVQAFVHYGTVMDDDAVVDADAFVMKGSAIAKGETWSGNPAMAVTEGVRTWSRSRRARPNAHIPPARRR